MNEEEYKNWIDRIKAILRMDNESEEFIDYLVIWFNQIQGSTEMQLLQNYHPDFINKDEEEIYDFMHKARYFVKGMSPYERKIQIFDSAFFLYRPCLKAEFNNCKES